MPFASAPVGTKPGPFDPDQTLPPAFFNVARSVYQDDPFWLGEDAVAVQRRFSRAHDFFREGKAWVGIGDH
ncbi:MAG TPA: hypothetical protein VM553_00565, partial [Dongiaceae bacterium]|nr:hypothetical protein [Dongiaceae bacterium]